MGRLSGVLVASVVLALLFFAAGAAVSLGEPSSSEPSSPSNSGSTLGWGGMVIKEVDCSLGTVALVDRARALSNPQKPALWKPMIVAELKDSVMTREGLKGSLTCKDLRPFQAVMLTGEVRESHTSWSAEREATANWLVVSARDVTVSGDNVFDSQETTITRSAILKEVGENFVVVIYEGREQKVALLPTTMIQRIRQGLWVEEPLTNQLRPGMRVAIGLTTRPDVEGVFTDKIAITSISVP